MRTVHRSLSGFCAVLLACCAVAARADDIGAPDPDWRASVLELRINGVPSGQDVVALRDAAGGLWLAESDFARLRLKLPPAAPHLANGRRFFPVSAIAGIKVVFDETRSAALISAPATAFETSAVAFTGANRPPISPSGTGAFLNYVLSGQTGQYSGANAGGAFGELGIFTPLGVLINTGTWTDIAGVTGLVRLENTFSHDFTGSLETLRLGDAISVPGSWGSAVRFGGVQWGTNYGIRPDLVTTPLLAATGTAVLPSTVEVFVNGKAVGTSEVPAGPFIVNQVPALNGAGDVSIVVRNALGQEQIVSVPFYSAAVMLQPGLSLWDVDLGPVRENYGIQSNDYGPLVTSATWRHGFTSQFTGEAHAEGERDGPWAAGIDLAQALDHWAVVTADLAVGGQSANAGILGGAPQSASSGTYAALGIQRVNQRLSLILEAQHATTGFRDLGSAGGVPPPIDRDLAQLGWSMGRPGSLQLAFVTQRNFNDTRQRTVSVTYQVNLGPGNFSAFASRTTGDISDTEASLFYVLPLGARRNTSTQLRYDSQQPSPDAALVQTLQQNLPAGTGQGYLVSAGTDGSYNLDYQRQMDALLIDAQAARYLDASAQRLTLTGGATYMAGELHATRSITDSFATVQVAGIPGMTVYYENQPVARTDDNGLAIVRDLRSFDVNRLSVDPLQLPLDTSVANPQVQIVPPYRSGVLVDFPVKRVRAGLFRLRLADGSAVPPGALVTFLGEDFPVGLDGLAYITNYDHGSVGEAHWKGGSCRFRLPPPPSGEPQPDLGVIACGNAP